MPQMQAHRSEKPAIQDFYEWVDRNRVNGILGPSETVDCPFMPLSLLESHFKAPGRLRQILKALFPEDSLSPINPEDILRGRVRIFAILILINRGRCIENVLRYPTLQDSHLPFLKEPFHFPRDADGDSSIWSAFFKKQFQFCPHTFERGMRDTELEDDTVLPIIRKEFIRCGGSAAIYKIKLHAEYDCLTSPDRPNQNIFNRPANTYILKTYNTKDAYVYYKNEVTAFNSPALVKDNGESIVAFYGSFKTKGTYNVLLEFADRGTLEDYFHHTRPPSSADDILMFYERFFQVNKALTRIHELKPEKDVKGFDILQGWHQDVDPSNILVFSGRSTNPYDVEFKLADLGLSHFQRVTSAAGDETGRDAWGTREYGAPECYRWDDFIETCAIHTKPYVDIWSFGCVCSEVAAWVVLGSVDEYRAQRLSETAKVGDFRDGAAFHDSENVLQAVTDMHELLMSSSRHCDYVTAEVLKQMVGAMLETLPEDRPKAQALYKTSERILRDARKRIQATTASNSNVVPSSVFAATPTLEENNQVRRDIHWPLSDPALSNSLGSSQTHFDRNDQKPGTVTIRIPQHSPGPTTNRLHESSPETIAASPSPPYTPPGKRRHEFGFVDEPLTDEHRTTSHADQQAPQVANSNDPYTPPSIKESENIRPSQGHGLGYSSPQHRRGHEGSDASQGNVPSGLGPDLGSPVKQVHTEARERNPALGLFAMPLNHLHGSHGLNKGRPPSLSLEQAKKHIAEHKGVSHSHNPFSRKNIPTLRHEGYLNELNGRDHVFLIDDSHSMSNYWSEVKELLQVLAWLIKRKDNDGFDVRFTISSAQDKNFKDSTPALKHVSNITPQSVSNMTMRLNNVLANYNLAHKPLSLYVFTDGNWQRGSDAIAPIRNMVTYMNKYNFPKERVGIQFIQFGGDPEGTKRLNYLDSQLGQSIKEEMLSKEPNVDIRHRVLDIVDTEPFHGDIMKMLLGAVNLWFDDDEDPAFDGNKDSNTSIT